jgi:hypothetical protein
MLPTEKARELFSWFTQRREKAETVDEEDRVQNAEVAQENNPRETRFLKDHPDILWEHPNRTLNTNAELGNAFQKQCQTVAETVEPRGAKTTFQEISDMEKGHIRQQSAGAEKAERLEAVEAEEAETASKMVYLLRSINEILDTEAGRRLLMNEIHDTAARRRLVINELQNTVAQLHLLHNKMLDMTANTDITENASRYCTPGRELTESNWNPHCESVLRAEGGTSFGAVAATGTYETKMCDSGTASSTTGLPSCTDGQSEKCPICLDDFVTQEVATPEACNHTFCVDCLQEWLKNTNTCPVDRQVCDMILVRRCQGGKVVKRIHVEPPMKNEEQEEAMDYVSRCEGCGRTNSDFALIYCGRCGQSYHLECVYPPLDTVPLGEWFCSDCSDLTFYHRY